MTEAATWWSRFVLAWALILVPSYPALVFISLLPVGPLRGLVMAATVFGIVWVADKTRAWRDE